MRRRELLRCVAVILVGPLAAYAQSDKARTIGILSATRSRTLTELLRQQLAGSGWVDGRNITLEPRSADGRYDRLPGLAVELASSRCAAAREWRPQRRSFGRRSTPAGHARGDSFSAC
jgi:putative ABC transport system substrate-binding protein